MAKEPVKYNIVLGANSDEENLAKAKVIFNKLKAGFILKEIEKYPKEIQKEIIEYMCKNTA
ncbi:MAG: hypothetical protein Q4D26_00385 [Clostridia bacterium]|nr:hypothetical protein [Clostridia bacterium]